MELTGSASFDVYSYGVGSWLYPKYIAQKYCRAEPIVIKKVYKTSADTHSYIDTFNRAWLAEELVPLNQIQEIIGGLTCLTQ